jgi:arabinogalactan oligomer/maltooligosaccharide transport system permease protein
LGGLTLLYVSTNLPFTIFFLRGFFEGIPKEWEEAFRLEGAGTFRVLTGLILPLSLPAVAVVSMFTFNAAWDDYPTALTMLNSPAHYTLPIGLQYFIGAHTVAYGPFFAASVIATIPALIVFLITLRWFRSGVSLGGIR